MLGTCDEADALPHFCFFAAACAQHPTFLGILASFECFLFNQRHCSNGSWRSPCLVEDWSVMYQHHVASTGSQRRNQNNLNTPATFCVPSEHVPHPSVFEIFWVTSPENPPLGSEAAGGLQSSTGHRSICQGGGPGEILNGSEIVWECLRSLNLLMWYDDMIW